MQQMRTHQRGRIQVIGTSMQQMRTHQRGRIQVIGASMQQMRTHQRGRIQVIGTSMQQMRTHQRGRIQVIGSSMQQKRTHQRGRNSSNRDEYATDEDTSKGQNSSYRGEYAADEDTSKGQNSSNRDESATDEAPSKVVYQKQFDEELLPFILLPSMPKEHIPDRKYFNNIISFCDYSGSDLLCTQLYDRLNTSQQHAVDNARKYRVSLVHGPPGTGKTTTACAIVCDIKKNFDYKKILVCAETNLAVDNLAIKFVDSFPKDEGINLLRINSRRDWQELRNPNAQSNLKVQEISLEHKLMIRMADHSNTSNVSFVKGKERRKENHK